jgi:hypothetical protein
MARLHHTNPDTIPADVREFLAKFPPGCRPKESGVKVAQHAA